MIIATEAGGVPNCASSIWCNLSRTFSSTLMIHSPLSLHHSDPLSSLIAPLHCSLSLPALSRGRRGHHSPLSLSLLAFVRWQRARTIYCTPLSLHWALITRDPLEGGEKENFHDRFASSSTGGERRTGNCRWHNDGNVVLLAAAKTNLTEERAVYTTGSVASNRQRAASNWTSETAAYK